MFEFVCAYRDRAERNPGLPPPEPALLEKGELNCLRGGEGRKEVGEEGRKPHRNRTVDRSRSVAFSRSEGAACLICAVLGAVWRSLFYKIIPWLAQHGVISFTVWRLCSTQYDNIRGSIFRWVDVCFS